MPAPHSSTKEIFWPGVGLSIVLIGVASRQNSILVMLDRFAPLMSLLGAVQPTLALPSVPGAVTSRSVISHGMPGFMALEIATLST